MLTMACTHTDQIVKDVTPKTPEGCEECLKEGTKWVQLRMCLICGHIGCCDSSVGKHATKNFNETGHPIMMSFTGKEPNDEWKWCYIDNMYVEI